MTDLPTVLAFRAIGHKEDRKPVYQSPLYRTRAEAEAHGAQFCEDMNGIIEASGSDEENFIFSVVTEETTLFADEQCPACNDLYDPELGCGCNNPTALGDDIAEWPLVAF